MSRWHVVFYLVTAAVTIGIAIVKIPEDRHGEHGYVMKAVHYWLSSTLAYHCVEHGYIVATSHRLSRDIIRRDGIVCLLVARHDVTAVMARRRLKFAVKKASDAGTRFTPLAYAYERRRWHGANTLRATIAINWHTPSLAWSLPVGVGIGRLRIPRLIVALFVVCCRDTTLATHGIGHRELRMRIPLTSAPTRATIMLRRRQGWRQLPKRDSYNGMSGWRQIARHQVVRQ